MIDIIGSLLPLVTVVVGLRLWTRAKIVRSVGFDDWVIVVALVRMHVWACHEMRGGHLL